MTHERIWTALVLALAFYLTLGAVTIGFVALHNVQQGRDAWALNMVAVIQSLYVAAIAVTLLLRWLSPGAGRVATVALNVILLTALVPLGTALGVYGLWKVDRKVAAGAATDSPTARG